MLTCGAKPRRSQRIACTLPPIPAPCLPPRTPPYRTRHACCSVQLGPPARVPMSASAQFRHARTCAANRRRSRMENVRASVRCSCRLLRSDRSLAPASAHDRSTISAPVRRFLRGKAGNGREMSKQGITQPPSRFRRIVGLIRSLVLALASKNVAQNLMVEYRIMRH